MLIIIIFWKISRILESRVTKCKQAMQYVTNKFLIYKNNYLPKSRVIYRVVFPRYSVISKNNNFKRQVLEKKSDCEIRMNKKMFWIKCLNKNPNFENL